MEKQLYKDLRTNFVTLFKLAAEHIDSDIYNNVAVSYASADLNINTCLEFIKQYDDIGDNVFRMSFFVAFENNMLELSDEIQDTFKTGLSTIYDVCRSIVLNHGGKEEVSLEDKINIVMKDKVFQKLMGITGKKMSKKKFMTMVENNPQLKKIFEGDIPSSMESQIDFIKDLFGDINLPFFNEELIKSFFKNIENKDTRQLFINVVDKIKLECPEIKDDISNIVKVFDNEDTKEMISQVYESIKDVKNLNTDVLKQKIQDIGSLQDVFWKVQNIIDSGLVNIERLKETVHKVCKIIIHELVTMSIISDEQRASILSFINNPSSSIPIGKMMGGKNKKKNKKERKDRRIKNYRRKKKAELKKKKMSKKRRA